MWALHSLTDLSQFNDRLTALQFDHFVCKLCAKSMLILCYSTMLVAMTSNCRALKAYDCCSTAALTKLDALNALSGMLKHNTLSVCKNLEDLCRPY